MQPPSITSESFLAGIPHHRLPGSCKAVPVCCSQSNSKGVREPEPGTASGSRALRAAPHASILSATFPQPPGAALACARAGFVGHEATGPLSQTLRLRHPCRRSCGTRLHSVRPRLAILAALRARLTASAQMRTGPGERDVAEARCSGCGAVLRTRAMQQPSITSESFLAGIPHRRSPASCRTVPA